MADSADFSQEMSNGSSQPRIVLAKPRLGGFGGSSGFGASTSSKSSNPFGSVLRPPQLKPTNNPFLKVNNEEETPEKEKEPDPATNDKDVKKDEEAPKFVPLGSANVKARTTVSTTTTSGANATSGAGSSSFVFGQNLSDRALVERVTNGDQHPSTNGTGELLFTSAATTVAAQSTTTTTPTTRDDKPQEEGLAAAAAEYERSHARAPLPAPSATYTGEEGETNVLQISCRLFAWEAGGWRERGRGVLRLNDAASGGGSRLVARVAGSLRVVLNTKLWAEMVAERAGNKSVRITASDADQHVKLYLIMGAPSDIHQLHRALTTRIANCKRTANTNVPQTDNSDSVTTSYHHETSQRAAERLDAGDTTTSDDAATANDETTTKDDRLATQPTDEQNTNDEPKPLKRKEPADEEIETKRPCVDPQ